MMYGSTLSRLLYKFGNAPIQYYPFPHFYIEDIFDEDLYKQLVKQFPTADKLIKLSDRGYVAKGTYEERTILDLLEPEDIGKFDKSAKQLWDDVKISLASNDFSQCLVQKFKPFFSLHPLLKQMDKLMLSPFIQLMHDESGYNIGPHTDIPTRFVNILFYFPKNDKNQELGTSIYLPKERGAISDGTMHHKREDFDRLCTVPYKPNSAICFLKTENSFHGVETVAQHKARDLLVYYLSIKQAS